MQFRGVEVKLRDGLEPTDQVRQDMYNAWLDLQNLHRTHPGDQYKCMTSDKGWQVSSLNGVDQIKLLGGQQVVEVKEKEEIKLKSEWQFIPGICMTPDPSGTRYTWYGFEDIEQSTVSVCATPTWLGRRCIIPEHEQVEHPGDKWPDYPARYVEGLIDYSYHDPWSEYWFNGEDENEADTIQDDGFNPVPYLGHSENGMSDYIEEEFIAAGATYAGADYFDGCDEQRIWYEDWRDYWNAQDDWGASSQRHDNTKVCVSYDEDGCCEEYDGSTHYIAAGKCGWGHLFFSIQIVWTHCHPTYDPEYIMGICFGYSTTIDKVFTTGVLIPITTYGEPQDRTYIDTYSYDNYLQSYSIVDREAGNIRSTPHSYFTRHTHNLTMPAPCVWNHSDTHQSEDDYPSVQELQGGYVKDANAQSVPVLQDKYFIIYKSEVYTVPPHTGYTTDNSWNITTDKPSYNSSGVYDHGIPFSVSSPSNPTKFACLWADINGERVLIDSVDIETDYGYFVCTDSHIVTCLGSVYYMYAYCFWQQPAVYNPGVRYTRYGYFKNTASNHIRSPIFLSAELESTYGNYETLHHDVYGSINFPEPLYGVGKCAGFLVKDVKEYV